ncbi:MAG: HAMP domain-containing histidine kinase [Deltaproteobacteria bacterium]|nr:HAMP domain-containing histidine kinase [Deltaproteobacteria bacterium]
MAEDCKQVLDWDSLVFFTRVTTSVTHEIKNELAVMNEQSHLIQEIIALAKDNRQPDPLRIANLIGRVIARIKRADDSVKRLNTFAHSADEMEKTVDAGMILTGMINISQRLASLKGISLVAEPIDQAVNLTTFPFLLEETIFACLEAAMTAAEKGTTITAGLRQTEERVEFVFKGNYSKTTSVTTSLRASLLQTLGADLSSQGHAFVLSVGLK